MMIKLMYLILSLSLSLADDNFLKNFKICKRLNPKLNQCLQDAVQKALQFLQFGVSEFNIPTTEPLELPKWVLKPTISAPFFHTYENIRLYNSANLVINEIEANISDTELSMTVTGLNPMIKFVSSYHYDNAMLFGMNITGNGTLVVLNFGNEFSMNISGNAVKHGEQNKLLITTFELLMDIEKIDVTLENKHLEFSKEKTAHTNKYTNTIYKEIQLDYSNMYAAMYKNFANSVFSKLHYDDVFPK